MAVPPASKFPRAFSSEVDTGSRKENASNKRHGASVPIQLERKRLYRNVPAWDGQSDSGHARRQRPNLGLH